jgi:CRISPR/Cas system CSM-associated protein Csm3 (group 7 of RAMP superfamily)
MRLETPILVANAATEPHGLPAASLRGMVRTVAEIAGQGCASFIGEDGTGWLKDKRDGVVSRTVGAHTANPGQRACDLVAPNSGEIAEAERDARPINWRKLYLCRTCGMFGFALEQACWRGRVRFEDARMHGRFEPYRPDSHEPLFPLYSPEPHHLPYYFSDPDPTPYHEDGDDRVYQGTKMAGRKVYVHHDPTHRVAADPNVGTKYVANKKCWFSFAVHFENLYPSELGLLLFALDLKRTGGPANLRHHYGYGKPAGYGSVRILVTKCLLDQEGWYEGFDEPPTTADADLDTYKTMFFGKRRPEGPDWAAFEKWMMYPRPGEVRYPTLEEIHGGEE